MPAGASRQILDGQGSESPHVTVKAAESGGTMSQGAKKRPAIHSMESIKINDDQKNKSLIIFRGPDVSRRPRLISPGAPGELLRLLLAKNLGYL